MAKYIGTYATSGDVQTALNNKELSRPFIAYTTDDDKVYYGVKADKAEVGDIVVYSVADDLLHYIKQADYNTTSYPAASYVPVGVVAYPQTDDAILGPTGEITFMGLNFLSKTSPDSGQSREQGLEWGYSNFDIPELTNYANSGTAITDMNGKANTEAVLQYATAQTDWKTASAITWTDKAGYYPAFECAWRYHTSGTVQGDWYVPACGQINYIKDAESLAKLNAGFTAIGVTSYSLGFRGTSTEVDGNSAWCHFSSIFEIQSKSQNYFRGRPFCSKLMTRI
jgi:hypothetical protein